MLFLSQDSVLKERWLNCPAPAFVCFLLLPLLLLLLLFPLLLLPFFFLGKQGPTDGACRVNYVAPMCVCHGGLSVRVLLERKGKDELRYAEGQGRQSQAQGTATVTTLPRGSLILRDL